jgi:hypothetical protein
MTSRRSGGRIPPAISVRLTTVGFNFGDGHLHNEDLIKAMQAQASFEPGELVVVWVESQPVHRDDQAYQVIDAALGVIERGTWKVADAVAEQPWLPNGPIPVQVTWSRAASPQALDEQDYERGVPA